MRKWLILAALLMALPASAQMQAVQQIFQNFGMIGVWAPACGAPIGAATDSTEAIYALSHSDGVILTYDYGPNHPASSYRILSARMESKDRLAYVEQRLIDKAQVTVTVVKVKGTINVMSSVSANGHVLVQDGRIVANGQETPRRTRCRI
ncbi:MAG: hypothetical protein ACREE3_07550 [Stellaceae bacterium]